VTWRILPSTGETDRGIKEEEKVLFTKGQGPYLMGQSGDKEKESCRNMFRAREMEKLCPGGGKRGGMRKRKQTLTSTWVGWNKTEMRSMRGASLDSTKWKAVISQAGCKETDPKPKTTEGKERSKESWRMQRPVRAGGKGDLLFRRGKIFIWHSIRIS